MPAVSLTLEEFNRTILYPAYISILSDIVKNINIPYGSMLVFHKDSDLTKTCNAVNVSGLSRENLPVTVSQRRLLINVNENYNEDTILTTAVHRIENYPLFKDNDIDVFIYPIYIRTDVEIEFNFITPSRIEAERIKEDLRIRLSAQRGILHHEIEYDMLIPDVVEEFIADVHKLKSRLHPQTLEDYFRTYSTKRAHLITDMTHSSNARLAVKERQTRIVGFFNFVVPEKINYDETNNNYTISFTYNLSIDIPKAMVMNYPIVICNQPIDTKYIQHIVDSQVNSREEHKNKLSYSKSLYALSHFEAHRQLENRIDIRLPINIPAFDEFHVKSIHKGYAIVTSFLVQINEEDKRTLFNLNEIDPYKIDSNILQYLRTVDRSCITQPYAFPLYLGLYQEGVYKDFNILEITPDLTVRSKIDLSLTKITRVLLSVIIDVDMIDLKYFVKLFAYPNVLVPLLKEIVRGIINNKQDLVVTKPTEYNTFMLLTNIYKYYLNKSDTVTLVRVTLAIYDNNHLYHSFLSLLHKQFNSLYTSLERLNVFAIAEMLHHINITSINDSNTETTIDAYLESKDLDKYLTSKYKNNIAQRMQQTQILKDFLKPINTGLRSVQSNYILVN